MTNDQVLEAMGDNPVQTISIHDMDHKTLMDFIVSCESIDTHLKEQIDMLQKARNDNKAELQVGQQCLLEKMKEIGTNVLNNEQATFKIGVSKSTIIHEEEAYKLAKNADKLLDFVKFTATNIKNILGVEAEKTCVETIETPTLKVSMKK